MEAFGEHLREIRISKNLSQDDLAIASDLSFNQIGRIERGEVNTTISTIYSIAAALEMPAFELLKFKNKK